MVKPTLTAPARPGDLIHIVGHRVGDSRRTGEVLEVLGEPGHEHYRVRWEDGRESVFYPSSDATISASRSSTGTTAGAAVAT